MYFKFTDSIKYLERQSMEKTKKILLINDMPGYGRVALSAMLPVLAREKYEIFCLPTVLLSNTLNYGKCARFDTTEYMKEALQTWRELGFEFDVVATGFIANDCQTEFIAEYLREQSDKGALVVADPIMADNGKLYNSITEHRIDLMRAIIAVADVIVPNITEACFLTGANYSEEGYLENDAYKIAKSLHALGAGSVLITSVPLNENGNATKAVIGYETGTEHCFKLPYKEIPVKVNGTGDIFSAIIISEILAGKGLEEAAIKATDGLGRLISDNLEILSSYNGLPIEACIEKI